LAGDGQGKGWQRKGVEISHFVPAIALNDGILAIA